MPSPRIPTQVRIEPEHFIPVSIDRLRKVLQERIEDDRARASFERLAGILEAIYHLEHHRLARCILADYRILDPHVVGDADGQPPQLVEDRFLGGIVQGWTWRSTTRSRSSTNSGCSPRAATVCMSS